MDGLGGGWACLFVYYDVDKHTDIVGHTPNWLIQAQDLQRGKHY